ncbi:MAG: hypothetical protein IT361_08790 [Gemmatimonadaceae bacterium]|nr:hypothetical protein [Gemmatimonadaceae bacterium]
MATSARLDELKKKFDDNPRRYFAPLANEYRKLGDLVQAIALCRTHLPNQPGHISGNIVLGQALFESRELIESRQAFEAALDLDPENLIALRYLGDIARHEGASDVAQSWYQRVLDADPRNDEIVQLMREVEAEQARHREDVAPRPTPSSVATFMETADTVVVEPDLQASVPFEPPVARPLWDAPEAETNSPQHAEAPALLELPSFDAEAAQADALAPGMGAVDDTPSDYGLATSMGDLEAVAEPTVDDWFAQHTIDAAERESESLFPDLGRAAADLPAPPVGEGTSSTNDDYAWMSTPDADREAPTAEFAADPTLDTVEFTVEAAPLAVEANSVPLEPASAAADVSNDVALDLGDDYVSWTEEAPVAPAEAAASVHESEAAFDPAPLPGDMDESAGVPFAIEGVLAENASDVVAEAQGVEIDAWSPGPTAEEAVAPMAWAADAAPDEASSVDDPETPMAWTEDSATGSAWDAALAPEQLAPASEPADELVSDPMLGRTPIFNDAIPEAPPAPFVTETMAELYLQQGFTEEGLAIYRQLLRQSPEDIALQRRVASLERGGESQVVESTISPAGSVRAFFARFATRPRRRDRVDAPNADADEGGRAALGGVASRDEALTRPDEPSSLASVFASRTVSSADAQAAATLASAFGIEASASVDAEGELSLGRLFHDVQAHPTGAVTSEGYSDATSGGADAPSSDEVESHADIEQFTAWLEGLRKK